MNEILLVEDSDALSTRILHKAGARAVITRVHDGFEALEYLFRKGASSQLSGALPVLILLDLHMPRVGGFEALDILRSSEVTKNMPIIVLTASDVELPAWEAKQRKNKECRNIGHLKKPMSADALALAAAKLGSKACLATFRALGPARVTLGRRQSYTRKG